MFPARLPVPPPPPMSRIPALTVVPPVYEFCPVRVSVPVPVFVKPTAPVNTAPIVAAVALTWIWLPVKVNELPLIL